MRDGVTVTDLAHTMCVM